MSVSVINLNTKSENFSFNIALSDEVYIISVILNTRDNYFYASMQNAIGEYVFSGRRMVTGYALNAFAQNGPSGGLYLSPEDATKARLEITTRLFYENI